MKAGFSLIEILCVMGLVAVMGVAVASTAQTRRAHLQALQCVSNLRQWGLALQFYLQDQDGSVPRRGQGVQPVFRIDRAEDWFNALPPYLEMPPYVELIQSGQPPQPGDHSVFVCPSALVPKNYIHFICYGMNMYVSRWDQPARIKISKLPDLSTLAFLADAPGGYASTLPSARGYSVQPRHAGRANVVFFDGHVQSFSGWYLGCGSGEKIQPDVRWKTGLENDPWTPN